MSFEEELVAHNYYLETDDIFYPEDVWMTLSGVINIIACTLIITTLLKINSKGPVHFFLLAVTIFDLIHQLFCPSFYKIWLNISGVFENFFVYKKFFIMYFAALLGQGLLLWTLLLRNWIKFIRKYDFYAIGINCVIVLLYIIVGNVLFEHAYMWGTFIHFLVSCFFILFVSTFIQQLLDTVRLGKEHTDDYKTTMVVILSYVTIRIIFLVALAITIIFYVKRAAEYGKTKVYMGFVQLNSIVNIFVLNYTDDLFKSSFYKVLKLQILRRNSPISFVSLTEDNVTIVNES